VETSGVMEEGALPTERKPEADKTTVAKLLFAMTGLYERWRNELMETRRYRDPRENDPDYARNLRELEGDLGPLRIGSYNEGGGGGHTPWKWILGVGSAIVSGGILLMLSWSLGKLDTLNQEVATLQATQTMGFAAIAQRQTADEQRIDRIEGRVYRGGP
jgi:hypothetical protein